MNPLEDCIVAIRAVLPINLPFKQPNSLRLMNPAKAVGSAMGFTGIDPYGNPAAVTNQVVNFGQEYVWHCHLLGHEENDMMRPLIALVAPDAPTTLTGSLVSSPTRVVLNWVNAAANMTGFIVERATNPGFTSNLRTFNVTGIVTTYTDTTASATTVYYYRVRAVNTVGDTAAYVAPAVGYPSSTAVSANSNAVTIGSAPAVPAAPTNLVATGGSGAAIVLTWRDNASNETFFTVQRSSNGGTSWTSITTTVPPSAGTGLNVVYTYNGGTVGTSYMFRVFATNASGPSGNSNSVTRTR
jgi:hypothetical protein